MSNRIDDLEPVTREKCLDFQEAMAARGRPVRITHTLRTDDEQNYQFAKGRTIRSDVPCTHASGPRPVGTCAQHPLGAIVTNARAGESAHNQIVDGKACAFDFCFDGKTTRQCYPPSSDPGWALAGEVGEALGLSWGGPRGAGDTFTFDRPHFNRIGWKKLRARAA